MAIPLCHGSTIEVHRSNACLPCPALPHSARRFDGVAARSLGANGLEALHHDMFHGLVDLTDL